jgi:hypothetical protein
MMWTFELYRILTAQRIAEMLREMDRERLAKQVTDARPPRKAASSGADRREEPATFRSPARHTG